MGLAVVVCSGVRLVPAAGTARIVRGRIDRLRRRRARLQQRGSKSGVLVHVASYFFLTCVVWRGTAKRRARIFVFHDDDGW